MAGGRQDEDLVILQRQLAQLTAQRDRIRRRVVYRQRRAELARRERLQKVWRLAAQIAGALHQVDADAVKACEDPAFEHRPGRRVDVALGAARKLAVYLTYAVGEGIPSHVAEACGLRRQTVEAHVRSIESRREDDDTFDRGLDEIELQLVTLMRGRRAA